MKLVKRTDEIHEESGGVGGRVYYGYILFLLAEALVKFVAKYTRSQIHFDSSKFIQLAEFQIE